MKFKDGKKAVTTAATRVALSSTNLLAQAITIKAEDGNAGKIFVGDITVLNTDTEQGLNPGDRIDLAAPQGDSLNLADIYIDAATSGDGVIFWYYGR